MTVVDRRTFLQAGAAAVISALPFGERRLLASGGDRAEPIRLSQGVHLLIDDYLIAAEAGIRRSVAVPSRLSYPIVTAADDHVSQPYVSVLWCPERRRFRMWYNTIGTEHTSHIGYMESLNGVSWLRPHLELPDPAPIAFGVSVIDRGPDFVDRSSRYLMAWQRSGTRMAVSSDGFVWTPLPEIPPLSRTGDIVSLSTDPHRGRYVVLFKLHANSSAARAVGQSVSDDGLAWSSPRLVISPGARDEGQTEFYGVGNLLPRGALLIGLLKVLRDDLPAEPGGPVRGIGYTVLAWSRDGEHWYRDRQPFLSRNPSPGTWDRAMTWGDCLLPVGDHVFIYYGGYATGHKVGRSTDRQLGFAWVRRDRFVAREAGAEWGWLRTPPLVFEGHALRMNADIQGELRARVLDQNGVPLKGFDLHDCRPVHGDSLAHQLTWGRNPDLSVLAGEPVQLEFVMHHARVYGIEVLIRYARPRGQFPAKFR